MKELFLGWSVSFGMYGENTPIVAQYQTWTEYCKQKCWNPEELKRKRLDEIRLHRRSR